MSLAHPVQVHVCLLAVPPEGHRIGRVKGCHRLPQVQHPYTPPHCPHATQHPHNHPRHKTPQPWRWGGERKHETRSKSLNSGSWPQINGGCAHQSPACELGTRQGSLMGHGLQEGRMSRRTLSPAVRAEGWATGRRTSEHREAAESDPSLQLMRENPARSSPEGPDTGSLKHWRLPTDWRLCFWFAIRDFFFKSLFF